MILRGDNVLFVCTKRQLSAIVKGEAERCGALHVTERWLGGTLTNLKTLKGSMKRMKGIEKSEQDGSITNYVKQEQSMIRREHARQIKYFDGIRSLDKNPGCMFVVDVKREHNAVAEARKLGIPVVAITDTNADPDLVDYPIAGNDDAIRSVRMILATVAQVITRAQAEFESKSSRRKAAEETQPAEVAAPAAAPAAPAA